MRILGIADATSFHVAKWANALARRGHHVMMVPCGAPGARPPANPPGIELAPFVLPPIRPKRPVATLLALRDLRSLQRSFNPDLVHAHFLGPGAWTTALAGIGPLIVSVMGGDVVGRRWVPGSRIERLLTPFTLRRAAAVTCWSHNLQRIVEQIAGPQKRTTVIVGGIDRGIFRPGPPSEELRARLRIPPSSFVVLSPRILWPLYRIDLILRGFARFREQRPDAVLLLVRYREEQFPEYGRGLDRLIQELGLTEHIRSLPTIPNREMAQYYRLSSCTVSIPSTDGTPMTVMESLACGTPVIISDLPEYDPEILRPEETVLRVDPADPAALSVALARIVTEPGLRERLVTQGAGIVAERADEEREIGRLIELYREILVSR